MKSSFGKYAILQNVRHTFEQEPDLWWDIKAPSIDDEAIMARFMSDERITVLPDGRRVETPPTGVDVAILEVALTFAGTNIPSDPSKPVEEGGAPAITPEDSSIVIENFVRSLPPPMFDEVWNAMGAAIPNWGPVLPKGQPSKEPTEEKSEQPESSDES